MIRNLHNATIFQMLYHCFDHRRFVEQLQACSRYSSPRIKSDVYTLLCICLRMRIPGIIWSDVSLTTVRVFCFVFQSRVRTRCRASTAATCSTDKTTSERTRPTPKGSARRKSTASSRRPDSFCGTRRSGSTSTRT